jgi:hypothetical protein
MNYKKRKRVVHTSLVVAVNLIGLVFIAYLIFWGPTGLTGYATFTTEGQSEFDLGAYNQTFYNDSGELIQLNLTYNNGTYTSTIFDAGEISSWRNISWGEDVNVSLGNLTLQVRSCESDNCNDSAFSGSYTNSSLELLSIANNKYFQYKFDFSTIDLNSSPYLYNVTIGYENISEPRISLSSPNNNSTSTDEDVTFSYVVSSFGNISNCSLIWSGSIDDTDSSITRDIAQSFSKDSISNGNYNWSINCTDVYGQTNNSLTRSLTINYTEDDDDDADGDDEETTTVTTTSTPTVSSSPPESTEDELDNETITVNATSKFNKTNNSSLIEEDEGWIGNLLTGFSIFAGSVTQFSMEDITGFFNRNWIVISIVGSLLVIFIVLSIWFGLKRRKNKDSSKSEKKSAFWRKKSPKKIDKNKEKVPTKSELKKVLG